MQHTWWIIQIKSKFIQLRLVKKETSSSKLSLAVILGSVIFPLKMWPRQDGSFKFTWMWACSSFCQALSPDCQTPYCCSWRGSKNLQAWPLECFSKDTLWKIKKPTPSCNRGIPRENISRGRDSTNKSRGSPSILKAWQLFFNFSKCLAPTVTW